MSNATAVSIREATRENVPAIHALIGELADYERLRPLFTGEAGDLASHLFDEPRCAHSLVALRGDIVIGFALYFFNYSTFLCKPGLYLEDLYVQPAFRGQGVGKRLLQDLARRAAARGCGRMEWSVLDWNAPSIAFYRSLGAEPLEEWTTFRLTGDAITRLAAGGSGDPAIP
jgi:GNAT superfamily N-acetyltransferase